MRATASATQTFENTRPNMTPPLPASAEPMKKVQQLEHAVDHRVAERDQRVHAAEREPVDELLRQEPHRSTIAQATPSRPPAIA
jgi:hypothetical protein